MDEEKFKKELEELKKEKDEYLAGWQRARADFINYKKEEMERIAGLIEYSQAGFLIKLLPLLDTVEYAERMVPQELKEDKNAQGFLQIGKQLRGFLKSQGVEELKAVEEKFNPEFHEAVGEVTGEKQGTVAEVVEKGYLLRGKLLRPAKVKVIK
ncbi:MAG: nucleotide exchange factor GrpE [Candidatus Wildermuthbacteria bacterium]|nr:nucleotide exchange factor GrpE [Candidatus Wildermuthbacteria bacterium]